MKRQGTFKNSIEPLLIAAKSRRILLLKCCENTVDQGVTGININCQFAQFIWAALFKYSKFSTQSLASQIF